MRREDILHAVPLVCVMVLKGCVLVLLTVMIVGAELNSPCQAALVMCWAGEEKKHSTHTHTHNSSYHNKSNQPEPLFWFTEGVYAQHEADSVMMTRGNCLCRVYKFTLSAVWAQVIAFQIATSILVIM